MSCTQIYAFREAVFARMQAKIEAEELGIVSLRKNDYGITLGNQARDEELYPIFIMKLKMVGMFDNVAGYGEESISYLCSIIVPMEKQSDVMESSANDAESILIGDDENDGLVKQVIELITQNNDCEITSGVNYTEGIYSGNYAIVASFTVTK